MAGDLYYQKIDCNFAWKQFATVFTGGQEGRGVALNDLGLIDVSLIPTVVGPAGPPGPAGSGNPGGATTQIQFNNAGNFGGESKMTYATNARKPGKAVTFTDTFAQIIHNTISLVAGDLANPPAALIITADTTGSTVSNHTSALNVQYSIAGCVTVDALALNLVNNGTRQAVNGVAAAETGALIGQSQANNGGNMFASDWIHIIPVAATDGQYSHTVGHRVQLRREVAAAVDDTDLGFHATAHPSSTQQGRGAAFRAESYQYGLQVLSGIGGNPAAYLDFHGAVNDMLLLACNRPGGSAIQLQTFGQSLLLKTADAGFSALCNFLVDGFIGIGQHAPTAYFHVGAGGAAAGSAPLKLTAGTNLTVAESGAMEFDGTNLYFTVGGVRKTVTLV